MQLDRCRSCGGELERVGNSYVCKFCGSKWVIDADQDVHVIDRANAWSALRDCDFEHAGELFENIIYKEPKNHEAYWGRALANAGIMYVTDFHENKKVPTCNSISESSFIDSRDVKRAIELAPADIAESYRAQAEQIEAIRVEWVKKASREPAYDVFISYKDSDREHHIERTEDSYDAHELYMALTEAGYKVFFSRVSLRNKVSEHYEPYIYNAIKTAKVMIVYGEKPEYFNAVWIKNEWMRFRKRIELGEKHQNSLVVAYKGLDPADLPIGLRSRQCIDASSITFLEDLKKHIDKIIRKPEKATAAFKVDVPAATVEVPEKKKSKKGIIIAAIAAVLAVCIGVGFIVTNLADGDGETTPVLPHETEFVPLPTDGETVSESESESESEFQSEADPSLDDPEKLSYIDVRETMYVNIEGSYCFIVDGLQHYLEYGAEVLRIGVSFDRVWSKIEYNGLKGYVSSEYLTYDKPVIETQGATETESETLIEKPTATETETVTETETETETVTETETETVTGTETETETEIEAHICSFDNWKTTKEPTCLDQGEQERVCECGEKETQFIDALGHTEVIDEAVAKTCTDSGLTEGMHCSVCETVLVVQETIPASHEWKDEYCWDSGVHWQICSDCDSTSSQDAHTLGNDGYCTVCDNPIAGSDGVLYFLSADGTYAEVVDYTGDSSRVVIAEEYEGIPVTQIGAEAFMNKEITSIIIPDSVTSIGSYAFSSCHSLTSVYITNIAKWCAIDFGSYEANPLYYANNLYLNGELVTELVIPDSVTSIGDRAFYYCDSLTSVVIPDSVTSIGYAAFYYCTSLTSVEIGDSVTSIGNSAFSGCSNITSATIPTIAISYIPKTNLQTLVITSGESIGDKAFYGCDSLTSVEIGDSVTSIGSYAFGYCTSLTSVEIGDSVTSIGDAAFYSCDSLTSVVIPDSVTSIGWFAFFICRSLTSVTFKNPNGWWYSDDSTATSGTSISSSSLANASTAAQYLWSTYYLYYWNRS